MKTKFYFLALCLFLALGANAQIVFQDYFEGSLSKWDKQGDYPENWAFVKSAKAGGTSPELCFRGKYPGSTPNKLSRIVSPVIDLSKYPGKSLLLRFKQFVDYQNTIELSVATTSDGGATWNTLWNKDSDFEKEVYVTCSNSDIGAQRFQIAFVAAGNFKDLKYWYVDNVVLSLEADHDVYMETVVCEKSLMTTEEDNEISISFKNLGKQNISSIEMWYQIDEYEPVGEIKTGLNVAALQSATASFKQTVSSPEEGSYTINAWVTKVNGMPVSTEKTSATFEVTPGAPSVTKRVLIEEFTASTCPPCATLNQYLNPWLKTVEDNVVVSKYQMNFPGSGDPYYNSDCASRSSFYGGINSVPTPLVAGEKKTISSGTYQDWLNLIIAGYTADLAVPASVDLKSTFSVTEKTITVNTYITPFISGSYNVYISVNEKKTTKNAASNGEKEFHHVVMKMLPGGAGKAYAFEAGVPLPVISYEQDLSGTKIEEFTDLEVAVYVQNTSTKKTLNATYAIETTTALPPPSDFSATVDGSDVNLSWTAAEGALKYKLYRNSTLLSDQLTGTSYKDQNVSNKKYTYYLVAVYQGIESVLTPTTAIVNVVIPPPTNLEVITEDYKNFTINWTAAEGSDIKGYNVYRYGTQVNTALITGTTFSDNVPYGGGCCYTVTTVKENGESAHSEEGCLSIAIPENVQGVQVATGEKAIRVSWDAVAGVDGYNIYLYGTKLNETVVTTNEFTDEVAASGEYCYTVASVKGEGESVWSEEACVTAEGIVAIGRAELDALIQIYPNPVADILYIDGTTEVLSLQVFDIQGRLIYAVEKSTKEIATNNWAPGFYIINIHTEQGVVAKRFVKK